jgi:glutamate-1-semialdehyde 2,1-aminomutase
VDGTRRLDFVNNYTALIVGHCHPQVLRAVREAISRGFAFASPTESEIRLAQIIQERVPSVEQLRFVNSGTEAAMFALRAARAFTGRRKIAKFEGRFHGTYDLAQVNVRAPVEKLGPKEAPVSVPEAAGIPQETADQVVTLPFNDQKSVERILKRHNGEIAALIVEPIPAMAGMIPPRDAFLSFLREITQREGIIFILDEIITLRVHPGGAQSLYGVKPDLTLMGKIIGGGFPVAAFGGRKDIMTLLDPRSGAPAIPHPGTYNGNPVGMAAGIATLKLLTPKAYEHLNGLGDLLRKRLNMLFQRLGVAAQATGVGSLFSIHFTEAEITDYRSARTADPTKLREAFLGLMAEGIFFSERGMGCLSTPMTEREVDRFVKATEKVLRE